MLAIVGLALIVLVAVWFLRFRIVGRVIDDKLAAAHVPAAYTLTKIGLFHERLDAARIGSPDVPDLVAQRIDITLGYGWKGPFVRAIRVKGVRLRAKLDRQGLSLGSIDRLMPKSSGGAVKLPDLNVHLDDVLFTLTTPNGTIRATLQGSGNPHDVFHGTTRLEAPTLRLASCVIEGANAKLKLTVLDERPQAAGQVQVIRTACPNLIVRTGDAHVTLTADKVFQTFALKATLDGFGGQIGPAHFVHVRGPVEAEGKIGDLKTHATLAIRSLALPDPARRVVQARGPAGTPISPTLERGSAAVARLLAQADGDVELTAALHGQKADIHIARLKLVGRDGASLTATERGGISWTTQGWRADADIAMGGGALPSISLQLRQPAPGADLTGVAQIAPYRAGAAQLATAPIHFSWNGSRATFATIVTIDGPIGDGFIRGLSVPVRGMATATGTVMVGQGCQPVSFTQAQLVGFTFEHATLPLCGNPVVARDNGNLRVDVRSGPIAISGHNGAGAPITLRAASVHLTQASLAVESAAVALGPPDRNTHLALATINGRSDRGGLSGVFADASGAIAGVPLAFGGANGTWRFSSGLLRVKAGLRVSDMAAAPRFNPLDAKDAILDLQGGLIHAGATLQEPTSKAEVAQINVVHDLSSTSGQALIDVKGITFAPKGLQPEALTPFTLGVIANVAGTVSGTGQVNWNAKGITSSGTFGIDKLDLAAAFGPVTGIKGQVNFTDLLGLVTAPNQEAIIGEVNPGVQVTNGVAHYQLVGQGRVKMEEAIWPFAGGMLRLEPTVLDFGAAAERRLTFRIEGLDAAAFIQQLDFPNIAATGTFDGVLPMIFDQSGGRIAAGSIVARNAGGTLAYVGELSNAQLGTMSKLAFDALKAIRYSSLDISLDGRLDGEMVSRVRFTGVREATPEQSLITRMIRNLPFRFNIQIRAPFRGLVGSARAYMDPRLLLNQATPVPSTTPAEPSIQTQESGRPL